MQEKQIEQYLCQQVKQLGGRAYKFVSPGCAGVPDRLVVMPGGRVLFVELKATGKSLRSLQRHRIQELKRLGCKCLMISTQEGIDALMREMQE